MRMTFKVQLNKENESDAQVETKAINLVMPHEGNTTAVYITNIATPLIAKMTYEDFCHALQQIEGEETVKVSIDRTVHVMKFP